MEAARAARTQTKNQPAPTATPRSTQVRASAQPSRTAHHLQAALPAVRLSVDATPIATSNLPAAALQAVGASGSGDPLPSSVQTRLEGSLNLSLRPIRIHTDARAAAAADNLGARAFTYGTHIYFGSRERPTDLGLTAHEVTHVVQQQGRPVLQLSSVVRSRGDAFEREADRVSAAVQRGETTSVHGRTAGPQVQRADQPNVFQRGARWLGERAGEVLEWAEDRAASLIERVAPDLMPIIRRGPQGIVEWLKERFSTALESVVNALAAPVRGITGVVASVSGHLSRLVAWIQDAYAKISRRDCSPVAEAATKIEQVFNEIASPVFDRIKALTGRVREFFSGIWNRFGAPAWDFLRQAGGAAWQRIQEFAGWVWDKTAPVRRLAARAWTWVKNQLGIGEGAEGQNGLLQWIERKASVAWDWVKERIEPIKRPLMIAGGVLLMLSPAGPFIALGVGVAGLIMGIRYLRNMRTPGFIVQARQVLHGSIIPGIRGAINTVTGALARAGSFITGKLDELTGGMVSLVGAVGGSILRFAVGVVNWIADQFRALASWAHDKLMALVNGVRNVFAAVRDFLQPVFDVLGRVIAIVANPFGIIGLLAGGAWRLIPECFKGPLINFILRIVIRVVRAIPGSPLVGLLWPFIRSGLLGFLEKALDYATAEKVRIADRFAKLATGGSVSFVFGYLHGLVVGLWDGISGPFVLLWDIAELIGGLFSWIGRALATITDPAVDIGRRLLAGIRGAWETIKSNILPAVQAFLSGPPDPMRIINFIRDILNSVVQAAGSAGGQVFDALIGFLGLGDRELGFSLGRFAGNILFEVLLTILTAGGYAAKSIIQPIARWITSFVGKIAKFASEVMRHFPRILRAVESVGAFARSNPAMQRIIGAVKALLSRLAGFLRSMYGVGGAAERGAGAVERAAGTAERAAGTAERAAGTAERAAGTAERAAGTAERAAGTAERAAGTAERAAGTAERTAGTAERAAGTSERAAGTAERQAAGATPRVERATQEIEHAVCGLCFAAGTKVITKHGYKNIEDLETGDYVLALDENQTGDRAYKRVLKTFQNFREGLVEIEINQQRIKSTPGHVWFILGKGWTLAQHIEVGDEVIMSNGGVDKVTDVRQYQEAGFAYNCEIEDFHTYFVAAEDGSLGIWVHNASIGVRTLRPDQIFQAILPGVVISDREAIRQVIGKSLTATGSFSNELSGLYSYLRRGGGAGHLGITGEAIAHMDVVLRNLGTKGGGVMAAIDVQRIARGTVHDLANPRTMEMLLQRYSRFQTFFTRLGEEGVIAVRGTIPARAVQSLVNIPEGISAAERRALIERLITPCRPR